MTHAHDSIADAIAELKSSVKFQAWRPYKPERAMLMAEPHYSPDELADLWGVSPQTIRNIFKDEPGVLRLPSSKAAKGKRSYVSMKIPESVAERVHRRYSAVPA